VFSNLAVAKQNIKFNGSQQFFEHPQITIDIIMFYLKKAFQTIAGMELDALR
jgi:hypothetical protein